jgi:predicted TIM-barrel fold metal-dependent hydrolase
VPFFDGLISAEGIVRELDGGAVNLGVLFASFFPHTSGVADNTFVAAQVRKNPRRLIALASLRVDQWNRDSVSQLAALERALTRDGMIGIKLAPAHAQTRLDDERMYPIYEMAARLRKPIYVHTGTSPFPGTRQEPPYVNPAYLEAAIVRYPGAVFVLGHAGYDTANHTLGYLEECIRLVKTYPNVQIEMGALGSPRADELTAIVIKRFREAGVLDRVLYGSDGPQGPGYIARHLERTVAAMQAEKYSVADMRAVFSGNFQRVFGVAHLAAAGD